MAETQKLTEEAEDHQDHEIDIQGEAPAKTIGWFGSLSLVANNISGPAMMGLPIVFRQAGIIPTVACILVCWVLSSLCGTFLAETIQKLPGNERFEKNIDFSYAFSRIVGKEWHLRCELLVIVSCFAACLAGIVETAQSLDSWIASFVLGKTYALTIPGMELIQWDSSNCNSVIDDGAGQAMSTASACTPFHMVESSVITLGYVITFALFYPMGTQDLKETIWAQVITFLLIFLLCGQFIKEFHSTGFPYMDSLPLVGHNMKQLAGVVLFNYAYPITIPSWLTEKKVDVPVNQIIWTASFTATVLYIAFGILAAAAYHNPGEDVLVLLASNRSTPATRFASAFFGISEIGVGVAIFCVIVKNSLLQSGLMSKGLSQFFGSLFPYLVSWYMYQGKALLVMLNWTGLLVNGLVAFILPFVLAHAAYQNGFRTASRSNSKELFTGIELSERLQKEGPQNRKYDYHSIEAQDDSLPDADDVDDSNDLIHPLPAVLEPCRAVILKFGILVFFVMIVSTIFIDLRDPGMVASE